MSREPLQLEEPITPLAAREDLSYIRRTLETAGHVSSVSGVATAFIGLQALGAVALSTTVAHAPWEGGKLERSPGRLILRLYPDSEGGEFNPKISPEEQRQITGQIELSSSHPVMQKLNPKVFEIGIEFP